VSKASAFDMNALDSRIRELVAYARERDGEDRSNLFRNLVDLFLTGKAPTISPTREQLLDVLEALIPHVDAEGRRTACELVAAMSAPPMDLVMRLARDRASLVTSLLLHTSFEEEDIIDLIERTGREHHQVIASREDLSANVWIALARAAPAAPPFDHQSTLALWSDDLGITRTQAGNAQPQEQSASAETHPTSAPANSATVTPLHPERTNAAAIRILRTDEDLIAARAKAGGPTGLVGENGEINELASGTPEAGMPADVPKAPQSTIGKVAQDPGPGGWAWISDRDGFVKSVSPHGLKLLDDETEQDGYSVLDLLGLNNKLDHPVARAFQRRSAIHDAPVFLKDITDGHQHWTLEATPYFGHGGIFEGYEGTLTPVVPASRDDELPLEEEDNALFLDEVPVASAGGGRPVPLSYADTPSVFQDGDAEPAAVESKAETAEPVTAHNQTHENTVMVEKPNTDELFSSATASAIRDVIADALTGSSKPSKATETEAPADENTKAGSKEAHIAATLEMLEDTIAKMMIAGQKGSDPQMRLYGEIANACIRSLKEQLELN